MSGSYAGLEALGGEDALNWNQEGFYQVAKIPLLFLSAIGSGSLAGRVGRSQSSNVVKRFAWMLADEGEMVPEQYLRSLGYDDSFIKNLTAKDMENIVSNNDWDWRMYCGNKRCNFSSELKLKDLKNFFDTKFNRQIYETNKEYDINIFSELYDEIICENCDASPLFIINNKHEYILNPEKIIPCEKCEKPILLTRLKIKKGTKLCTPCARGEEKSKIQRIKDHNDQVIPKSPPIPPPPSLH